MRRPFAALIPALSDAGWLDGPRLRRIALVFAMLGLAALGFDIWQHTRAGLTAPDGEQLGRDFVNYWAGAHLAAHGHAVQVYDLGRFAAWERAHTAPNADFKWFSYPPVTLLVLLPLAGFGFAAGYAAWLGAGWLACAALLRRHLGPGAALLAAAATPAAIINALSGQNGAFSACLMAGGLLSLKERPWLAGMLFGTLVFKPHLAILVPVALVAGGQWRTLAAAALTAAALCGASLWLFGAPVWAAFLHNAPINALLMEHDHDLWHRMPSAFAAARLAGAGIQVAAGVQLLSAAGAAILTARVWRSGASSELRGAVLIVATFLATPYAWDYDLVSLTFAVVWLAAEAQRTGFRPWEKIALFATLAMPLAISPLAAASSIQVGPLMLWALLGLAARRVQSGEAAAVRAMTAVVKAAV